MSFPISQSDSVTVVVASNGMVIKGFVFGISGIGFRSAGAYLDTRDVYYYKDEGVTWCRGHLPMDSDSVKAMLVARALML